MGIFDGMAQGLRAAGSVLNPAVQAQLGQEQILGQQQAYGRQNLMLQQLMKASENGAIDPTVASQALAKMGINLPDGAVGPSLEAQKLKFELAKAQRIEEATKRILSNPEVQQMVSTGKPQDLKKVFAVFAGNGLPVPAHLKELMPTMTTATAGSSVYADGVKIDSVPEKITPLIAHDYAVQGGSEPMVQPHISHDKGHTWQPIEGTMPTPKFARQVPSLVSTGDHAPYTNVQPDGKGGFIGLSKRTGTMEQIPQASGVAGGLQMSPEAIDQAAATYRMTRNLPTNLGKGAQGANDTRLILNRAAEQARAQGDTADEAAIKQVVGRVSTVALQRVTTSLSAIRPYNNMLELNGNMAVKLADKAIATDSKLANRTINWLKQNATDNPDVAEFLAQAHIVSTEAGRVLNNPNLTGVLTEGARADMKSVISGDMPFNSFVRVMKRLQADGRNRVGEMEREAGSLKSDIAGKPRAAASGVDTSNPLLK